MIKYKKINQSKINSIFTKPNKSPKISYIRVDKRLLEQIESVDFDIYYPDKPTHMSLFLQSNSVIDSKKRKSLQEIEEIFTKKSEKQKYDLFLEEHIQNILDNSSLSLDEKTDIIYESTSELTQSLYENPDGLKNVKRSKKIVKPILESIIYHDDTVSSYIKIIEYDYYTHTHSLNVSIYALCLGAELKMSKTRLANLGRSALLHDLGKSKIDIKIVNKNGYLTDDEFELMKKHPSFGYRTAMHIGEIDKDVLDGIRHHHEKLNGHGYPDHLKGDEITLFPRIIAICDVFDALTTRRSYKDPMNSFNALKIMKKQMNTHLDMKLLGIFIQMLHQ